ncbi:uncharacterized protein LOC128858890 [Anastrepha ludens]|uniref:uncharacterized protein LOC128858890 n=1 Tax=Anastrepha ludens TaxID=28586 RepID=UPI0023AF4ED0|nr:uncharacterized protein LOC128858890 [Anastrepha ludens]
MERKSESDKELILTKSELKSSDFGSLKTIILRHANLEQTDIDMNEDILMRATYLDLSYNEKIVSINLSGTQHITLYLRNCSSLRDIRCKFGSCALQNLDIAGCSIDLEEHFFKYDFPRLANLTLSWQSNVKWRNLFDKLKTLQRLTIENICCQNAPISYAPDCNNGCKVLLKALSEHKSIKAITFGGLPNEDDIAHLSTLTGRELGFHIRDGAANCLARLCNLKNLHTIYLEHATNVTDANLLKLIVTCPNLAKITLDYCAGVTENFIFQVAEFLRERDKDRPLKARLNLEMCGCAGISEDIQEHPLYAKAESAMSLILFFKCKHATTSYRNDLIIPYPPPNIQLSIYMLFEIYRQLRCQPSAHAFAAVCEDFENAAIEEERHLKIVACCKAKIVCNDIYNAYLEITSENKDFFKNRPCTNATRMELSCRKVIFESIFDDFPKLEQLKLVNCCINMDKFPRSKKCNSVRDLEIWHGNPVSLWRRIAMLFPNTTKVIMFNKLNILEKSLPIFPLRNVFENVTSVIACGNVLNDEDIKFLKHLPNLKTFDIFRNSEVTGKYISEFLRVEQLSLHHCENLNEFYLADILSSLALKSLDIRGSSLSLLSTHLMNEMWLSCVTLTKLKMDWLNGKTINILEIIHTLVDIEMRRYSRVFFEHQQLSQMEITRFFRILRERRGLKRLTLEADFLSRNRQYLELLTHLTHLSIIADQDDDIRITPDFYKSIGKLINLEYLYLANFSYCYDGVIHIVGECRKVKVVRLKDCVGFSDFVAYDIVEVLKRKRVKHQLPLSLYLIDSREESTEHACSEDSSSSASDAVPRFADIQDFIEVIFVEEQLIGPEKLSPSEILTGL